MLKEQDFKNYVYTIIMNSRILSHLKDFFYVYSKLQNRKYKPMNTNIHFNTPAEACRLCQNH